ncbi:MAG: FHA domain-containing protein [Verrucomicrobia bacterium]|nr:FHA domain-containing protein [Verrucomicrobiota bacterium]
MPRLVVLSEGLTGRTHELKTDKVTIGRVEDNSFQVPDGSVSSHHCEIYVKGSEVWVKDLGSTNGSFINGQQITEAQLRPSQILRLGQVEIRFEGDTPAAPQKRVIDHTQVIPQGIKLNELDQTAKVATNPAFEKKSNKGGKIFLAIAIVVAVLIVGAIIVLLMGVGQK